MNFVDLENKNKKSVKKKQETFAEGIDYYFENGLMILTEHFLTKRGFCCKNGCRHCPYPKEDIEKSQ